MVSFHTFRVVLLSAFLFVLVDGHCKHPRVRREWRSISAAERASWVNAITCLANLPHDPKIAPSVDPTLSLIPPLNLSSSNFDDWSYVHMDLNVLIHNTGFFLPWHRMFVQTFEDDLRLKCGYDGVHPYWDWTQDTSDFYHATIFSDSTFDGVGSWGDPDNDYQITTGSFKDILVAYPIPHYIRRNFTNSAYEGFVPFPHPIDAAPIDPSLLLNTTFTSQVVDRVVGSFTGDYRGFQATLENLSGPHPGPHLILGGEMGGLCPAALPISECHPGPKWSPNDPLFFLHHAMIDKLWYDWQHRSLSNKHLFSGGSVSYQANASELFSVYPTGGPPWLDESSLIPGDGLWEDVRVCDVMSTVGGRLCYVYA